LSLLVGEGRAVSTALQGLGVDRLVAALPYVQVPAVSSATRHLAEKPKEVISALSSEVADQAGVEVPEPVKLQRVTLGDLVTVGLIILVGVGARPSVHQCGLRRDLGGPAIWELGSPHPRPVGGAFAVHRPGDGHHVRGADDTALLAVAHLADR